MDWIGCRSRRSVILAITRRLSSLPLVHYRTEILFIAHSVYLDGSGGGGAVVVVVVVGKESAEQMLAPSGSA